MLLNKVQSGLAIRNKLASTESFLIASLLLLYNYFFVSINVIVSFYTLTESLIASSDLTPLLV